MQIECEVGSVVGVFGTTDASTFHLWVSHLVVAASLDYDILLKDDEELLRDCRWMRARRNDDAGGEVRMDGVDGWMDGLKDGWRN